MCVLEVSAFIYDNTPPVFVQKNLKKGARSNDSTQCKKPVPIILGFSTSNGRLLSSSSRAYTFYLEIFFKSHKFVFG